MSAGRQLLASDMPRAVRLRVFPSMRWLASSSVVILLSLVPWAHGLLASIAGGSGAYALGTALMLVLAAVLPALWPPTADLPGNPKHFWFACPVMVAGLALLGWVSVRLLPPIFAGPLDPNRGDMLVIIEHAIAQFLSGRQPLRDPSRAVGRPTIVRTRAVDALHPAAPAPRRSPHPHARGAARHPCQPVARSRVSRRVW